MTFSDNLRDSIITKNDIQTLQIQVQKGNTENVEELLNAMMKRIVDTCIGGKSALGLASALKNDNYKMVDLLLKKGAELDSPVDSSGTTALGVAAYFGNITVLKELHKQGASINAVDRDNSTALHSAAFNNQSKCIEYLLENGSNIEASTLKNRTPLLNAAFRGMEALEILVKHGANLKAKNNNGWNALHYAACAGNTAGVEYLCTLPEIDVNSCTNASQTALELACQFGHPKTAVALIKAGAKDTPNQDGELPLQLLEEDDYEEVKTLLQLWAEEKMLNTLPSTPIGTGNTMNGTPKTVDRVLGSKLKGLSLKRKSEFNDEQHLHTKTKFDN